MRRNQAPSVVTASAAVRPHFICTVCPHEWGAHDPIVVVEHDDDLPALLDEGASAPCFEAKLVEARVRPRAVLLTSEEAPHLGVIVARASRREQRGPKCSRS